MITVKIKKGYPLKLAGAPATDLAVLEKPSRIAVLPERMPFIKPRLKVQLGDTVERGALLFEDKRNPDIRFLSPGGGLITNIAFGPRRVIQEIVIELDASESSCSFTSIPEDDLEAIDRHQLVQMIIDGGMWAFLHALPFRDIPNPDIEPPGIVVTVGNLEPFHPRPEVFLKENSRRFRYGIKVLERLSAGRVSIAVEADDAYIRSEFNDLITHTYAGPYPAHDAGVVVYHAKLSAKENRTWYIDAQDLLLVAELLETGTYPVERTVAVAGSLVNEPRHVRTRIGAPLRHLTQGGVGTGAARYIAGGVLSGYPVPEASYLGVFETSLTVLPDGSEREFLALFRPGYQKPSYSRAYLSALNPNVFEMNCNLHGGRRPCIACNSCTEVCPVDILPQLTYKSVLAGEIEDALAHGLLDCAECGLCTYVCPSKIELNSVLKNAKAAYYKEQVG
jgi:Na+-transporting NADH:ubiquinone oxidoreductase subunit A